MTLGITADLEAAAQRVSAWCGEPLLHEGENADSALAPGTARRAALDAAIAEMDRGLVEPSFVWRRDFSLILGLDRMLSAQPPRLASGTALRRHQVDALAGQLAAPISSGPSRTRRRRTRTTRTATATAMATAVTRPSTTPGSTSRSPTSRRCT